MSMRVQKVSHVQRRYSQNPSTCICEITRYFKKIAGDSLFARDEIINFTVSISTNLTNTISGNVTSTVSINPDDKKVRYKMDCYIWHTLLK